jgi:hypothetical protein
LVARGEIQQRVEPAWSLIDVGVRIADCRQPSWHGCHGEIGGIARVDLLPRDGSRNAGVGLRAHRVRRRDGTIFCVLIEIDEDPMSLFLPPFAGRERRRSSLHLARQGQCRPAYLDERPPLLDSDDDVHAT